MVTTSDCLHLKVKLKKEKIVSVLAQLPQGFQDKNLKLFRTKIFPFAYISVSFRKNSKQP